MLIAGERARSRASGRISAISTHRSAPSVAVLRAHAEQLRRRPSGTPESDEPRLHRDTLPHQPPFAGSLRRLGTDPSHPRDETQRRVAFSSMPGFRSLPAVGELAKELDAPHALAVAAARATIEERREELQAGAQDDPDLVDPRARAPRPHAAAVAAPRDQRHRRDRPHQPRPRAARRSGARRGHASGAGLLQPRVGRGDRRPRLAPRPRRAPPHRAHRRRGRARRQQRRRRGAARRRRAGRARQGDRGLPRPARRDRRRLPHPGRRRPGRRAARRGGDHEPHAPGGLRRRADRAHRRDPPRPPVELPPARLRPGGRDRGAVRARRAGDRRRRLRQPRRGPRSCSPTSRRCGARSGPARRSCASPGTSCSAARRPA